MNKKFPIKLTNYNSAVLIRKTILKIQNNIIKVLIYSISVLPSKCLYSFYGDDSFKDELGSPFEKTYAKITEQLWTIHISHLDFKMVLSFKELQLIKEIISSPNSKNYLRVVHLELNTFDEVVEILELIWECFNIMSATLEYQDVYTLDMGESEETIREVKNKYINWIIC